MDDAGQASTDESPLDSDAKETIMKKTALLAYPLVVAVSLFAAAGAAFAEDGTIDHTAHAQSLKSRDQVQAELFQARADGSIKVWSTSYNPLTVAKSLTTRDAVKAERVQGYDATWYGEDSGSFALQRQAPSRVATPVYAQAR